MSSVHVRAALEAAVAAITPSIETAWENRAPPTVASGTPYQRVNVLFRTPDNTENNASFDEVGFLQIMLCYPQGAGAGVAAARADLIRAAFPRGRTLSAGGVTTTILRTPDIRPGMNEGDRWIVPVRIRFVAQIQI